MTTLKDKSKFQRNFSQRKTIPEALVYERLSDGSPVYYRGYKQYLKGTKTIESIVEAVTSKDLLLVVYYDICISTYLNNIWL